ncbi:hypothetical protein IC229_19200 [Spirosoma sp. BT702]|uniref:Uncharacterized protein n=1 Tax=Spirosoma profusum TaxID=2771354 RepID=A0A926Y2T2_9BACT|nr:hypothetical protein [Spirosoma profusum]MBD2702783.1 hypothetical protein [Spirosoma profusum]
MNWFDSRNDLTIFEKKLKKDASLRFLQIILLDLSAYDGIQTGSFTNSQISPPKGSLYECTDCQMKWTLAPPPLRPQEAGEVKTLKKIM